MGEVGGRSVVLEGLVMLDVIGLGDAAVTGNHIRSGACATGGAVGIGQFEIEATLKPAPREPLGVEQVADVLASKADIIRRGVGADVTERLRIADEGETTLAVEDFVA